MTPGTAAVRTGFQEMPEGHVKKKMLHDNILGIMVSKLFLANRSHGFWASKESGRLQDSENVG